MQRLPRSAREQALAEAQRQLLDGDPAELGRVLDIGCADGRAYSRDLRQRAREYVAVELDLGTLRGARAAFGADALLANGNAERLPFVDESFDTVVLNDMLAYCDKPRVLAEVRRVLRPGGRAISLHNNSLGWSLYKLRFPEKPPPIEWTHSLLVIANTLVWRLCGYRPFRTTFNTRRDLAAAVRAAGLALERIWSTRGAYTWWHFVARKPAVAPARERGTVLLTGSYLSQNMGAAAMTIVAARELARAGFEPVLLAKYPADDAPFARRYGIATRAANQYLYTFGIVPLLLLAAPVRAVRDFVRRRFFADATLCYDLGGITFAASRGPTGFVINLTWLLLPVLLGIPLVKGAQAMGPFDRWYLRAALPLLRRIERIHARGALTRQLLAAARIRSVPSADIAFLLEPEAVATPPPGFVALVPSAVVRRRYDGVRGDGAYVALLAELARRLLARGERVLVVPHCYRAGETDNSNDLPLCRQLDAAIGAGTSVLYDPTGRTPGELRHVLAQSRLVVTSRFHAMVAALASGVPVVATSWSHKYREVLDMFALGQWCCDWRALDGAALAGMVDRALGEAAAIGACIRARLPAVMESARTNFERLPHR